MFLIYVYRKAKKIRCSPDHLEIRIKTNPRCPVECVWMGPDELVFVWKIILHVGSRFTIEPPRHPTPTPQRPRPHERRYTSHTLSLLCLTSACLTYHSIRTIRTTTHIAFPLFTHGVKFVFFLEARGRKSKEKNRFEWTFASNHSTKKWNACERIPR